MQLLEMASGSVHTAQERRKDKYGQNVRLICACGQVKTNWHTDLWKAKAAWGQIRLWS